MRHIRSALDLVWLTSVITCYFLVSTTRLPRLLGIDRPLGALAKLLHDFFSAGYHQ